MKYILLAVPILILVSCEGTNNKIDSENSIVDNVNDTSRLKNYETILHDFYTEKEMLDTQLVFGFSKNDVRRNMSLALIILKYDSLDGYRCEYYHKGNVPQGKIHNAGISNVMGFRWKISDSSYHKFVRNLVKPKTSIDGNILVPIEEVPYSMYIDKELYISQNINDKDFKKLFKYLNDSLIDRHIKYW